MKLAVLRQVAYAHSVRRFIREILKVLIPGKWIDRVIGESDATFDAKLDAAFATIDESTATKDDYCRKVVNVLCDEVARLCEVLREVCEGSGYGDYARCYISHEKFVRLLLRTDTVKLGRLKKALAERRESPTDLLREIGAIFDDRPREETSALDAAELRRANAALKAIAADVKKTIKTGFAQTNRKLDECKDGMAEVSAKVDAVDRKVSMLRRSGKQRGRYTQKAKAVCWSCWTAAANHEEIWRTVNTRITYKAVFDYYRARLAKVGVNDHGAFRDIIRAEDRRRNRELAAQFLRSEIAIDAPHGVCYNSKK